MRTAGWRYVPLELRGYYTTNGFGLQLPLTVAHCTVRASAAQWSGDATVTRDAIRALTWQQRPWSHGLSSRAAQLRGGGMVAFLNAWAALAPSTG